MQRLIELCGAAPEKEKENSKTRKKEVFALVASVCSRRNFPAVSMSAVLLFIADTVKFFNGPTARNQKHILEGTSSYSARLSIYLACSEELCGAAPMRVVRCSAWFATGG